ncbi:MAG: hypothetical protein ACKOAC_06490, partial [Fluviibacter sp.]
MHDERTSAKIALPAPADQPENPIAAQHKPANGECNARQVHPKNDFSDARQCPPGLQGAPGLPLLQQ